MKAKHSSAGLASQSRYNGCGNILLQLALLVLMSALEPETLAGGRQTLARMLRTSATFRVRL